MAKVKVKRPADFNSRMHSLVQESLRRFEDRQKEKKSPKSAKKK